VQGLLKQPGYRLYPPDSPDARALLAEQGLGPADLDRALAHLEHAEGTAVRTIVGINEDGLFGVARAGWRPDLPDACREPFIPLLWLKVHELLGRVPEGSTAQFIKDGTLPREAQGDATGYRMGQLKRRPEALTATDSTPPYRWDCVPTAAWHVRGTQAGWGWFLRSLPAMAPAADPPVPPPCLDR
jgi:hypothetical protein